MSPLPLLILLAGCSLGQAATDPQPQPRGDLALELVDETGAPVRAVQEGEVLDRGALIRFVVEVQEGYYLHLLQRNDRGVSALYPSTGLVWMRPVGVEHLVPQPPYMQEEERQLGFNGEDDGAAEYLLVVAPSPRPVPADSWLPDLGTFLAGPPYIVGPAAGAATVVDRVSVVWGAEVEDPTAPQLGGDDEGGEPVGEGEDDPPEVGGEGGDPDEVGGEEEPSGP